MARLFRSKSCSLALNPITAVDSLTLSPSGHRRRHHEEEEEVKEEEEEEEEDDDDDDDNDAVEGFFGSYASPVTTPFISHEERRHNKSQSENYQFSIVEILLALLRKSLVTCSVERDDVVSLNVGCPTDVRHVSHVTFDPFNGFLGLPVELQPHVPRKVPSASANVFGVSAQSMHCSYDQRGNSVPAILLMMQDRLYSEGGLKAEGIFRINAENSQEEDVRIQMNRGVVPCGVDVHCLAGLIKAWFRELPTGVLDSLSQEQVLHCNTEEECTQLVNSLPMTEAALLDWAINLMADVVQREHLNKMNARNIAMVFAPNMTRMADPLTALIHAVQVMNLLKMLILKTLRERAESAAMVELISSTDHLANNFEEICPKTPYGPFTAMDNICRGATMDHLESHVGEFCSFNGNEDIRKDNHSCPCMTSPEDLHKSQSLESNFQDECANEGILGKLGLRKGMEKLCRHPVFQPRKSTKKNESMGTINDTGGGETVA